MRVIMKKQGIGALPTTGQVITDGLKVYLDPGNPSSYNLGDSPPAGSVWTDLSGNGNDAYIYGAPTMGSDDVGGYFNFSGLQWARVPTTDITETFTYCVWVKELGSAQYATIIDQNNDDWLFYSAGGGTLATYDPPLSSEFNMPNGEWNNVGLSHTTGGPVRFWHNGTLVKTTQNVSRPSSPTNIGIGAGILSDTTADEAFVGGYAVVQLYNRELSESEMLQNFNAFKSRFGL